MSGWLALLGAIAGIAILAKAVSQKDVEYFRCGNCNRIIQKHHTVCPFCKYEIQW